MRKYIWDFYLKECIAAFPIVHIAATEKGTVVLHLNNCTIGVNNLTHASLNDDVSFLRS